MVNRGWKTGCVKPEKLIKKNLNVHAVGLASPTYVSRFKPMKTFSLFTIYYSPFKIKSRAMPGLKTTNK